MKQNIGSEYHSPEIPTSLENNGDNAKSISRLQSFSEEALRKGISAEAGKGLKPRNRSRSSLSAVHLHKKMIQILPHKGITKRAVSIRTDKPWLSLERLSSSLHPFLIKYLETANINTSLAWQNVGKKLKKACFKSAGRRPVAPDVQEGEKPIEVTAENLARLAQSMEGGENVNREEILEWFNCDRDAPQFACLSPE
uniref:Uncharacterized protein n=1 Tax=Rhodnius prolixus TaxID=13249 RepID=T1HFX5_RHOPR